MTTFRTFNDSNQSLIVSASRAATSSFAVSSSFSSVAVSSSYAATVGPLSAPVSISTALPVNISLQGSPTAIKQIGLGNSSVWGIIGTRFSAGTPWLTYNASQTGSADGWARSNTSFDSYGISVGENSAFSIYYSPSASVSNGPNASFWSTPIFRVLTTGTFFGSNGLSSLSLVLNANTGSFKGMIYASNGINRWASFANGTEAGSNGGANYALAAYDDSGVNIDTPMSIVRAAGGTITLTRPVNIQGNTTTFSSSLFINDGVGTNRIIWFRTSNSNRWSVFTNGATEGGASAGSNFFVAAYDDSGVNIDTPISIVRAPSGSITFSRPVVVNGGNSSFSVQTGSFSGQLRANVRNVGLMDVLTNTTINSPNNFAGPAGVLIPELHEVLYSAESRFIVSSSNFLSTGSTSLFSNDYLGTYTIQSQSAAMLTLKLNSGSEWNTSGSVYPDGYVQVTYYFTSTPASASLRVNRNSPSGWSGPINPTNTGIISPFGVVHRFIVPGANYLTDLEFTWTAPSGSVVIVQSIQWVKTRTEPTISYPYVNKSKSNNLYGTTTWRDTTNTTKAQITSLGLASFSQLTVSGSAINVALTRTPTSTSDVVGTVGDISRDDNFVYVKTSTGWKRAALSTF